MDQQNMSSVGDNKTQGPIIGIIIVIIVLLVGAFYFMGRLTPSANPIDEPTPAEEQAETMPPLSESDEVSDIEADLEAEDFSDIDAELETF